jgi:hypothetical protein
MSSHPPGQTLTAHRLNGVPDHAEDFKLIGIGDRDNGVRGVHRFQVQGRSRHQLLDRKLAGDGGHDDIPCSAVTELITTSMSPSLIPPSIKESPLTRMK